MPKTGSIRSPMMEVCFYRQEPVSFPEVYFGTKEAWVIEFTDPNCMDTTSTFSTLETTFNRVFEHVWPLYGSKVSPEPDGEFYRAPPDLSSAYCLQSDGKRPGVIISLIKIGKDRGLHSIRHALTEKGCSPATIPEPEMVQTFKHLSKQW